MKSNFAITYKLFTNSLKNDNIRFVKRSKSIAYARKQRVNKAIRSPKVKLIDHEGTLIGEISTEEALKMAEEVGLDLVEINPNEFPPLTKILDWGKHQYTKSKNKGAKKKQQEVKVVRLGFRIGDHDLDVKAKRAIKFLEKGDKVKASLLFKGREITHKKVGEEVIQRFKDKISEVAEVEKDISYTGREVSIIFMPKK